MFLSKKIDQKPASSTIFMSICYEKINEMFSSHTFESNFSIQECIPLIQKKIENNFEICWIYFPAKQLHSKQLT